ncbi:hypothetical protein [Dethiosulfatarculus sandiegensis]|uniref:Uncharacterized protein n=1 Tax=Dethiosulfatarculus sandiegensis TaxID=1429043 RepID=A0A0D2HL09_9BACT|nr:hypothetical protein [Dethiosulfatarculus sandiegensis]KIX11328.1 hypothetical protein X474_23735 [Dethiosulfatarculus sandiegensis]
MSQGQRFFSQVEIGQKPIKDAWKPNGLKPDLPLLLKILDFTHIQAGLLDFYGPDYPLVEPRELIPSFDAPLIEYRDLGAFSLVALDRELSYQDEGFQFDLLSSEGKPANRRTAAKNRRLMRERLPRNQLPQLDLVLGRKAVTPLHRYKAILPHLLQMDRGHVLARNQEGDFHLSGIFASFPSDLDGEIKRFGRQIGKFKKGDNHLYASNRLFVYRFLMEQHSFPICGERHTSAALFARRLLRRRQRFFIKVLGNSDRAVTTLTSLDSKAGLPRLEKVALVSAQACSREISKELRKGGYYIDPGRRVVILRVRYQQHAYHPYNVLEERALSVASQEVIHPKTGKPLALDILGLSQDRLLMLNDIVRGEFEGSIVFQNRERVVSTSEMKNRLKFLVAWMSKHRYIISDYSPDNFERIRRVIFSFLEDPDHQEEFSRWPKLLSQVHKGLNELKVAHRLRLVERLVLNKADYEGRKLKFVHVFIILVHFLSQEGVFLLEHHPKSLGKLLTLCRKQLNNPYFMQRYLSHPPRNGGEREVVGEYRLLTRLVERFEKRLKD